MKWLWAFLALLVLAGNSQAQALYRYDNIALNQNGSPIVNANVQVCAGDVSAPGNPIPCTVTTSIYSNNLASPTVLPQPLSTGPIGNYGFYIAPGVYTISIFGSSVTPSNSVITIPCTVGSVANGCGNGNAVGLTFGSTTIPNTSTPPTTGQCLEFNGTGFTGAACSGGASSFSSLGGGTNTTAAMLVGTGASLNFTGSGTINASSLGGATFAAPGPIGGTTPGSGAFTTLSATGQITSTVSTGTAPLVIASTTNVPNLNASSLNGATFAAPGPIGSTTPSTGAFTTLSASSTVSGAGFNAFLASPPAIGGTAAAAGSFTTLTVSSTTTLSSITGSNQCLHVNSSGVVSGVGADCSAGGGGVSSITGTGVITNNLTSGAVTITVAGNSGGLVYFPTASTWSTTATPTANSPILGGGVGVAPFTASFLTTNGVNQVNIGPADGSHEGTLGLKGQTSGTATFIAPAIAGTTSNPVLMSNSLQYTGSGGSLANPAYAVTPGGWGMYWDNGTNYLGFSTNSINTLELFSGANKGVFIGSNEGYNWTSGTNPNGTVDTMLCRQGAGVLEVGSGATCGANGGIDAATLTLTGALTTNVTGSTQCLQANSAGVISGTGATCGSGSAGVTSLTGSGVITNAASTGAVTLTIAGTSGGVPYFNSSSSWASSAVLTQFGVMYGGGPGAPPTVITPQAVNGTYNLVEAVSSGVAVAPTFVLPGVPVDVSNPATLLYTDRGSYINWTSGTALALPAVATNFASNYPFVIKNTSTTLTITPNAGNADLIDGSASTTLIPNFAAFVYQDSTSAPGHWFTVKIPTFAAFGATCANGLVWNTSSGIGCAATAPVSTGESAGGDLGGTYPNPTVIGINGTNLAGLATGVLFNTTATGVPSIATNAQMRTALGTLPVANGGTGSTTAAGALVNLLPTGTQVGDILYCSSFTTVCTAWTLLAGNNSGTNFLQETSAGVPSWVTPPGGGNVSNTGTPTAHQVAIWTAATTIEGVGPGSSNLPLVSGGSSADPSYVALTSAGLNITTTSCTNQYVTAISAGGVGTCSTITLASASFANQGTTTTVLHGNGSGNPSFGAVNLATDVSGQLPIGAVGSAGLSASAPIAISSAGAITCTLCASNVMTTLGDILYENSTPQPTRLAGSTSASLAVLTQTGTGSVSAAPAWSTAPALSLANATGLPLTGIANESDGDIIFGVSGAWTKQTPLASGIPPIVGTASNVTAQSSSQSSAVVIGSSPTAGQYHVVYYADLNTPCTTGSNAVSFTFNWTDGSNARSLQTGLLSMGSGQTTSTYLSGNFDIWVGSGNVTYTSTVSGACASGTSSYDIHVPGLVRLQ